MTEEIRTRIGMVNFINTAPLYEIWKDTVLRPDWQVVEGAPAELNKMLYEGRLDLGFVSSHEYALHPNLYKIMSGLSISATGTVGSVYLFSDLDFSLLTGRLVQLSSQSQTSNSLIKIILEEFMKVKPDYCMPAVHPQEEISAVLAIGDQALRIKQSGKYKYALDLSDAWRQTTGLPFVFAVWAVREEFCRSDKVCVAQIHQELLRCVDQGKGHLSEICKRVAPRIPMAEAACKNYLEQIEYDLTDEKIKSLELFYKYLISRGDGDEAALPLKILN